MKKLLLEQFSESGTNLMIDECYQKTISMRREIVISTDKSGPPSHALINSPALHRQVAPQLKKGFESPENRLKEEATYTFQNACFETVFCR